MAISILNITTAALNQTTYIKTIPATTAGSLIIVSVTTLSGVSSQLNYVYGVYDTSLAYTYNKCADLMRADGGSTRAVSVWYYPNVVAGLTSIYCTPNSGSVGLNTYAVIYEVAGANVTTPLETSTAIYGTDSVNNTYGPTLATAFTNALFITPGTRGVAATWNIDSGYTPDYELSAGSEAFSLGHKIASGSNQVTYTHPTGSAVWLSGVAVFKPYIPSNGSGGMLSMFI